MLYIHEILFVYISVHQIMDIQSILFKQSRWTAESQAS